MENNDDSSNNVVVGNIVEEFDKICLAFGDEDVIEMFEKRENNHCDGSSDGNFDDNNDSSTAATKSTTTTSICYFEIQEYSKILAYQLVWRFGWPDYILIDCQGYPAAEAVATLASMRINRPFVPVSCLELHQSDRMKTIVTILEKYGKSYYSNSTTSSSKNKNNNDHHNNNNNQQQPSIVAVTACDNDLDPILSVFQQASIHRILYLNRMTGALQEQIHVPDHIPFQNNNNNNNIIYTNDDLYVMFTSGTSGSQPKAVIGSHQSTYRRLTWFIEKFESSSKIGRRTNLTFVDGVTELWASLLDYKSVLAAVVPPYQLQSYGICILLQPPISCTQLLLLPSQLYQLLLLPPMPSLERLVVSGEPCLPNLVHKFHSMYPNAQLINLYGQTETTGDCTCAVLTDLLHDNNNDDDDNDSQPQAAIVNNVVAVGTPISKNTLIHLRQSDNQLIISGDQLSNGYLVSGDDNNTNKQFTSFETGDTGFCKNGVWYVQGRCDDVVKVDGKWTSPSEIEAAFSKVYDVTSNAATVVVATVVDGKAYVICNDPKISHDFTREDFHDKAKIPWNLVPHAVICHKLPPSTSGAGKVNRKAAKTIAHSYHHHHGPSSSSSSSRKQQSGADIAGENESTTTTTTTTTEHNVFHTCVMKALGGSMVGENNTDIDIQKSFIELGGDSGKSITLLYLLQQNGINHLTAADIIMTESLQELEEICIVKGEKLKQAKRRRTATQKDVLPSSALRPFEPAPAVESPDKTHKSFQLRACVDMSPLIVGSSVYAACQGGVILKIDSNSGNILGHYHLMGWMVQADLLAIDKSILVCAYTRSGNGMVLSLSDDLCEELWKVLFDEPIKSTPLLINKERIWVVSGNTINILLAAEGKQIDSKVGLPHQVLTKPVMIKTTDGFNIVYASSDYEGCLMVVNEEGKCSKYLAYSIGPVHNDMTVTGRGQQNQIVVADSYGSLHHVNLQTMEVSTSRRLSNVPLATPKVSSDGRIYVGCYDGTIYCVEDDKVHWECDCGSSIYSKVACADDGSYTVACTTAGKIIKIDRNGKIAWQYRLYAEIWSNPVIINPSLVAFGARDSTLHFLQTK